MRNIAARLFGRARDLRDPKVFHQMSLVAFLAWVGLGADGLSSSSYGPEEAFKALGHFEPAGCYGAAGNPPCHFVADFGYLAVFLAIAIAATVFIISWGYRRIIEEFPHGGGGYIVASKHLGPYVGAVSGSALLVDYVLTIAISLAAGGDAVFSFLPESWLPYKHVTVLAVLAILTLMNLRGVKESVTILTPIFLVFLLTHAFLIFGAVGSHVGRVGEVSAMISTEGRSHISTAGLIGVVLVFLRAFSLGGGTFTGIEAVSNGMAIMREPRVRTAKRTMLLMATSLAITASGILLAYLLLHVLPRNGKTMNAVLAENFVGDGALASAFIAITLMSEGALLFVAAQAGFVDGPRVMANMALDQWMPHRFAALSEQLTMQNGVYLMAIAAAIALGLHQRLGRRPGRHVQHQRVHHLLAVERRDDPPRGRTPSSRSWRPRRAGPRPRRDGVRHDPRRHLVEKFTEGGWVTTVITAALVTRVLPDPQPLPRGRRQGRPAVRATSRSRPRRRSVHRPARRARSRRSRPRSCSPAATAASASTRCCRSRACSPASSTRSCSSPPA